jgi:hypothetical protein
MVLVCLALVTGSGRAADGQAAGPTGTIAGVVLDRSTADPIIEAGVEVIGTGKTVRTDLDGRYTVTVPPGTYQVRIFAPLYQGARLERVVVTAGQATKADASLAAAGQAGVDVVEVIAQADRAAEATQLLRRKRSAVVSDTMSAEAIRKTPGSAAADVAKRAPAVTVRDDKYIYVRGLGERYTSALLNGSRLPSTDPERRVVPLDLFPAEFLESISIVKSYTPDLPGDFSGGLALLQLRDFPDRPTFGLGLSGNANTQVTGKDFGTYRGPTADYFGLGAYKRRLPGTVPEEPFARPLGPAVGRSFPDNWAVETIDAPPGAGINVTAGNTWGPFGLQVGGVYGNEYKRRDERVRQFLVGGVAFEDPEPLLKDDYRFTYSTLQTKLGGVLSSALKLGDATKLSLRALVNRNAYKETLFGVGQNDNLGFDQDPEQIQQQTRLRYTEEELALGQLAGEHAFPWFSVDWRTAFARTTQEEPDMRHTTYRGPRNPRFGPLGFTNDSSGGLRLFNDLEEIMTDSALDVTVPFSTALPFTDVWSGLPAKFRFGPAYTYRDRDFQQRRFVFDLSQSAGAIDRTLPPEELFDPSNIGPGGFEVEEQTQPRDAFAATHEIIGGYGMFDLPLVRDRLRFVFGVRMEYSLIRLETFDELGDPVRARKKDIDPLPGANLILSPRDDMNVRLAWSRSVSRPEFRELSPVQYPAPRGLRPLIGNPDLVQTAIESYDLRWEWFLGPLELLSFSAFFKSLDRPIEQVVIQQASNIADSFDNADTGQIAGFEIEGRKDFGFLGPSFEHLSFLANFTYADSMVEVGPRKRFQAQTSSERQLQGQAPFIANGALDYTHPRWGTARLLYTTADDRIASVGAFGLPDIVETRREQIDAVAIVPLKDLLGVPLTVKLAAENLLNDHVLFLQGDAVQRRFTTGVEFSFGLSYAY